MRKYISIGILVWLVAFIQPIYGVTGYEQLNKIGEIAKENYIMGIPFETKGDYFYYLDPEENLIGVHKISKASKVIAKHVKEFAVDPKYIYYVAEESFKNAQLQQKQQEYERMKLGEKFIFSYQQEVETASIDQNLLEAFQKNPKDLETSYAMIDKLQEIMKANTEGICKTEYIYRVNLDGSNRRLVDKGSNLVTDDTLDYLLYITDTNLPSALAFHKETYEYQWMHETDILSSYFWKIEGDRIEINVDLMAAIGGTAKSAQFDRNLKPLPWIYLGSDVQDVGSAYYHISQDEGGKLERVDKNGNNRKILSEGRLSDMILEGDTIYYLQNNTLKADGSVTEPALYSVDLKTGKPKRLYDASVDGRQENKSGKWHIVKGESKLASVGDYLYFVVETIFENKKDSKKDLRTHGLYRIKKDGTELKELLTLNQTLPGEYPSIGMTLINYDTNNIYLKISEGWSMWPDKNAPRIYGGNGPFIYTYLIR